MKKSFNRTQLVTASALGLVLVTLPHAGHAADSIPPEVLRQLEALQKQVQTLQQAVEAQKGPEYQPDVTALEQKVKVLERKQELADEDAAKRKKETPVLVAGDKGFGLKSPEGDFELKLRGLVQADARVFDDGIKGQHVYRGDTAKQQYQSVMETRSAADNFTMRRVRPTFEGTLYKNYGFRITPDFGSGSTFLADGYIDANYLPEFKIRAGKFTPPLGLERLQSSADTKFNELALTSNFIPSRDVGAQISGDLLSNTINYSVGIFNGANDGATGENSDSNTDKELQARVFTQPFINHPGFLQGLGVGVAASNTNTRGSTGSTNLTTYKTSGQENFFSYRSDSNSTAGIDSVFADGERTRLIPQFHYFNGPFGLIGEYVEEQQELSRLDTVAAGGKSRRTKELSHDAWQLTAAYTLTGEEQSLKGIKPAQPFNPGSGGWGAWEVVARAGTLNIDKDAFTGEDGSLGANDAFAQAPRSARSAENLGVGLNWYPNKAVRVSLDYETTIFEWGGGGTRFEPDNRPDERVLLGRVQVNF